MAKFDIIGQSVLSDLKKKFKQFEHAVIAGGMVRDNEFGQEWKDIDVFIPYRGNSVQLLSLLSKIDAAGIGLTPDGDNRPRDEYKLFEFKVTNWLYHKAIKVQLIFVNTESNENFGKDLIERFNYGIDQGYYNGEEVIFSDQFLKDKKSGTISLVKLDNLSQLPDAMKKFYKLSEKYPKMRFASPLLEVKKNKPSSSSETYMVDMGRLYYNQPAAQGR